MNLGSLGSRLKRPKIVNLELWWLLLNTFFAQKTNKQTNKQTKTNKKKSC